MGKTNCEKPNQRCPFSENRGTRFQDDLLIEFEAIYISLKKIGTKKRYLDLKKNDFTKKLKLPNKVNQQSNFRMDEILICGLIWNSIVFYCNI